MKSFVSRVGKRALVQLSSEAVAPLSSAVSRFPTSKPSAMPYAPSLAQPTRSFTSSVVGNAASDSEEKYIAGIRIPPKHTECLEEAWRYYRDNTLSSLGEIWELVSSKAEIIPPFEHVNTELVGKAVVLTDNKKLTPILTVEKIREIEAVVFLGLDTADDPRGIVSGIQGFRKLLGYNSNVADAKVAAFYPECHRDKRYKDGLTYFTNEKFTVAWAEQFVSTYIVPRLVDDNGSLLPPDEVKSLAILGYSLGARESIMVENAILDLLQSVFNKNDEALIPYMNKFFRFGIGYAVNWDFPSRPFVSTAISIVTVKDIGIKRPQSFTNGAFGDGECFRQPVTVKHHTPSRDRKPHEFLVILRDIPAFVEKNGEKRLNRLGHGLPHYLLALEEHGQEFVDIVKSFMKGQEPSVVIKSQEFKPDQSMSEAVRRQLLKAWSDHLYNQGLLEDSERAVPSNDICNNSQKWQECFSKSVKTVGRNPWTQLVNNQKTKENSPER